MGRLTAREVPCFGPSGYVGESGTAFGPALSPRPYTTSSLTTSRWTKSTTMTRRHGSGGLHPSAGSKASRSLVAPRGLDRQHPARRGHWGHLVYRTRRYCCCRTPYPGHQLPEGPVPEEVILAVLLLLFDSRNELVVEDGS